MKYKIFLLIFLIITSSYAQNKNKTIGFKENKGQILDQNGKPNHAVKYLLNSAGLNVQIKTNGFSYDIYETKKHALTEKQKAKIHPSFQPERNKEVVPDYSLEHIYHRIDIDFMNSNPNVELIKEEKSKDYDNYYNVPNKPNGVLKVYRYQQITYKNIYPNIDVVFTVPKDTLKTVEYNFVIHPKGKISDIQLKFRGAATALVDNKIRMSVRFGEMEETLPASWTEDGEVKKEIAVGYKKIKKNVFGFESAENVSGKTVVIDPVPTRLWGTFYGDHSGSGQVLGTSSISTDSFGNVYVAGSTNAQNSSYATTGAHQTTQSSSYSNGIIEKFSPNGNRLWGTYYGGQNYCGISDIKIDFQDDIIVTGTTQDPTEISTVGSYKQTLGGYQDAFLAKFNSSGVRLWATYFGGEDQDLGFGIDVDINNNIYLIGQTASKTGISINSKFQTQLNLDPNFSNSVDGFLTKFGATGNLIWSTYVGGETIDILNDIAVKNNFMVIGGTTYSFNSISTSGVFQELHNPIAHPDGVVYKFSLDGERTWATYYGGEQIENIYAVEIDDEDNIYIGGETASNNNITTPDSFESSNPFLYKGFLAKLNTNGTRIWGTYIGQAHIYSIIFRNNSIYLGATNFGSSYAKLTTPCSYRSNKHFERYIAKFSKDADFIWGTDIGGDSMHSPTKIALDQNNNIFASSISRENNGIADASSYQSTVLGFHNYFLMKFEESVMLGIPKIESNSTVCIGETLELKASGGTNYLWTGPNGFTSSLQNPTIPNVTVINSGKYFCIITGTGGCDDTKSIDVFVGDAEAPVPDLTTLPTISGDCNTSITTIPTATDTCTGVVTGTTTSPLFYTLPGTYTIVWNYQDGNGNSVTQEQKVIISAQPLPVSSSPQTFCIQQNATLNSIAITGQNVKWYDALTNGNILDSSTPLQNGITYYASQTINGCESERTAVVINIQNTSIPIANTNQTFCSNQNPTIAAIQVNGTDIKWYDASSNGSSIAATTNLINGATYYATQTINNCESPRLGITVSIVNTPASPTANAFQSFCKNENATLSSIQISGQNIKWYDSTTSTITLANDKLLVNNTTYYASQTIGCESSRIPILIRIQNTPLPLGQNNQQFCIDENPLLSNLTISGTAIKWYDTQVGGNLLLNTTPLLNGKTYFATQTINGCESERLAVTSTIQDTAPPTTNAMQSFCVQKNAKISDISILGQNINWFDSLTSSTSLSEYTLLTNGTTYYASQTVKNCESTRIPILITILDATNNECINLVDELPYPKFFTPNNDGFNDTWTIDFNYLEANSSIRIFDRYGKLVKELRNNDSWDGTYLGHVLPATDYWFTVSRKNGSEFKSHFSLKR